MSRMTVRVATAAALVWMTACGSSSTPSPPTSSSEPDRQLPACPVGSETAADCPWASVARDAITNPQTALTHTAGGIVEQLNRDSRAPAMLATWGLALNVNQKSPTEFGTEPIVLPALVDQLMTNANVAPRRDRIVHAGVQHTYGYLFSLLSTPYGFKRARWVQRTIDNGLGLPEGTIAPAPVSGGTLLGNVTWLAGSIAFADEPEQLKAANSAPANVSPAVQALDASKLAHKRLVDTVTVAGRTVELRTDFVELPHPTADASTLLIYSVKDGATSRLVTMFPISAKSRDTYQGVPVGDGIAITTQYNAWVDGLTGTPVPGKRVMLP